MAALFTGSVRAPLTGIVLIIEMTGNYQQLLAVGVACLIADLMAGVLRDKPIYESWLEADLHCKSPINGSSGEPSAPRAMYVGVKHGSAMAGCTVRVCGVPPGCLVVAVERGGREILPEAGLVLHPGDHLSILVPDDEPQKAMEVIRLATGV